MSRTVLSLLTLVTACTRALSPVAQPETRGARFTSRDPCAVALSEDILSIPGIRSRLICAARCARHEGCVGYEYRHVSGGLCTLASAANDVLGPLCEYELGVQVYVKEITCGMYDLETNPDEVLGGYNDEVISSLTLDQCLEACQDRDWCRSVDFFSGICNLSTMSHILAPGTLIFYVGAEYFYKLCQ